MSWLREPDAEPIPGYRLIEPLGSGGFGEVWKCVAPGGILKAIKFVYGNLESEDIDAVRAEQEKKALERVKLVRHPFVLSIERIDILDGELAIVMELADKSLHDLFVECQSRNLPGVPRADLLRYLSDAADGLDHLIERFNLQHLDVKPRNLFLIADRVKVADFGLVKNLERQSASGLMGGVTPIYAAPETFSGKISKHSDQYSLAIVYMELLTGRRPFAGRNVRQIALQHMTEPPDLSPLPDTDRAVVVRALAKDPNRRFPSCQAFVQALAPAPTRSVASLELDLGPVSEEADLRHLISPDGDNRTPPGPGSGDPHPTSVLQEARRPGAPRPAPGRPDPDVATAGGHSQILPQTQQEIDLRIRAAPPRPIGEGLRPTLFVGVGSFGRHALLELRCRLLDRFGDLEQLPSIRFLYLDSDPDSVQRATAGTTEVVLSSSEVFPMPLQPVSNYRRRMLDFLSEWLPREKLYSIPRSLQPLGSRALGRLAFCDNFLRLQGRLRRELTMACQTERLMQTAEAAGLPAADNCPRVFVVGAATDGVSGMLVDLGFALRRTLDQLNFPHAPTAAVVYCGAPSDPATPAPEQANLYATLTELNHYQDPGVSFLAQYGPEGPQLTDHRSPYDGVYLTLRRDRTPEGLRECVAHLATYLTHDLATPLGTDLDRRRDASPDTQAVPFRAFGTSTVWYPRGLLLRLAARRACERLLGVWRAPGQATAQAQIEQAVAEALADPALSSQALLTALNQASDKPGEGSPTEATERFLAALEVQAAATEDAGLWSVQALERVRDWAGAGTGRDPETPWQKSRFFRQLQLAAAKLAEEWDERLTERVLGVLQYPGHRLTNGEAALRRLVEFFDRAVAEQLQHIDRHHEVLRPLRDGLPAAQAQCQGSAFTLFGGGKQRALRQFLTQLSHFARLRITQDMLEAGLLYFRQLRGRLEDRVKDIGFSRQRLKALEQVLSTPGGDPDDPGAFYAPGNGDPAISPLPMRDPFWEAVQGTATVEIVLPAGVADLEQSADQFVDSLQAEHWLRLDEELHAKVLAPLGNLLSACTGNANLLRHLGRPLVEQSAQYLGGILPITDVAQVEFTKSQAQGADLAEEFRKTYAGAAPLLGGQADHRQTVYLLVPDSEAGRSLGQLAQQAIPSLHVLHTASPTELAICREQDCLTLTELQQLLKQSRLAYQEKAPQGPTSPHARFDVLEWMPLEP
jgi:serine/threonine protein kinase